MNDLTRRSLVAAMMTGVGVTSLSKAEANDGAHGNFKLTGHGVWDNLNNAFNPAIGANLEGTAYVANLGTVHQAGNLFLETPDAHGVAPGQGTVTLTTATGHQLTFRYSGLLDTVGGTGLATVLFIGGTGKYATAYGTALLYSEFNLKKGLINTPMTLVEINGTLKF